MCLRDHSPRQFLNRGCHVQIILGRYAIEQARWEERSKNKLKHFEYAEV